MAALAEALSALDRAAKVGAIHPNAAARRKSRLTRKVNAALGGDARQTGGRVAKTTGKAAAAKAAKARIAAGKAGKAKGAQTAAGKARAALSKTARAEAAAAKAGRRGERRDRRPPKPAAANRRRRPPAEPRSTKTAAQGATQAAEGRAEGDRQGRCEGEEGRRQGVAAEARPRRHDDAPDPRGVSIPSAGGRFRGQSGAAIGPGRRRPASGGTTP